MSDRDEPVADPGGETGDGGPLIAPGPVAPDAGMPPTDAATVSPAADADAANADGAAPAADVAEAIPAGPDWAPPAHGIQTLIEEVAPEELPSAPAAGDEPPPVPDSADLPPHELRAVLESLLFVATRPLTVDKLAACLPGASAGYLAGFLAGLAERYDHERRGWELRRIAGGWQLLTRREFHPWVRQLEKRELPSKLSRGAMETLAIVAYKQPITRGEIEDIRGVQCGPVLRQLMDLKLVQVAGRAESVLGRPLLYATTESFLGRFGLGALDDLPRRHEFGA